MCFVMRQTHVCRDKTFVTTKIILVAAPTYDSLLLDPVASCLHCIYKETVHHIWPSTQCGTIFLHFNVPAVCHCFVLWASLRQTAGGVSGMEQEHSLSKARVKHNQAWSPNGWVTIKRHYVLGFALTLRFVWSQLCSLYKGPLDETINQGPPCEYACKHIIYTHIKDPVVHVRIWWTMETTREPSMH